jgi:hypothetical protein
MTKKLVYNNLFCIGLFDQDTNIGTARSQTIVSDYYPGLGARIRYLRPKKAVGVIQWAYDTVTGNSINNNLLTGKWHLNITSMFKANYIDISSYGIMSIDYPFGETIYFPEDFYLSCPQNPSVALLQSSVTIINSTATNPNAVIIRWSWSITGEVYT